MVLLRSRVSFQAPTGLVYVMKTLFQSEHGMFRQLTCPLYGVTDAIIRESCADESKILRVLSTVVATGTFQFAQLGNRDLDNMRHRVQLEVAAIREGRGHDLIEGVMGWVWSVQLRALQDHAT